MTCLRMSLFIAVLLNVSSATAQVVDPPPSDKSDVYFRYRIRADRDERIRQFREMMAFLKKLDFVPAPREDSDLDIFDPTAELMNGTMPTAKARKLIEEAHIQTAIILPAGLAIPEDGAKLLDVRMTLTSGLAPKQQQDFHSQVALHLEQLGFRHAASYDTMGATRLRGQIPAMNLLKLLKDLRTQPTGWFGPTISPDLLPLPMRAVLPIRIVEVFPELPVEMIAPPAAPTAPSDSPAIVKLSQDVRQIVEDAQLNRNPIRVDVILEEAPGNRWRDVRIRLRSAVSNGSIEGLIGLVVTMRVGTAAEVVRIAELPEVRSIRLPRAANETALLNGPKETTTSELTTTKIAELHQLGYRGEGVRVVVLASGFPGVQSLIGKELPNSTKLLDLTGEVHPDIVPAPESPDRPGTGTVTALSVHRFAPKAELTLVRIEPTAFHQLAAVARAVLGDANFSDALQARSEEFVSRADALDVRRKTVSEEYRKAFSDLSDDDKPRQRRDEAVTALNTLLAEERNFKEVVQRFAAIKAGMEQLRGSNIVVNTLTWDTGYPQDALSEVSRLLEERFTPKPVESALRLNKQPPVPIWIQPASISLSQIWAGPFLDTDGNGIMEFAGPDVKIPARRWSRELNFLGFAPNDGQPTVSVLPAGTKIRLTVAWREPHNPDAYLVQEPIFPLNIRLFKQLDPEAKQRPSDDLLEMAWSTSVPARLTKTTASAAFEQTLEATIPTDGVYCFRVEGGVRYDYNLPATQPHVEVYPRVVLEAGDNATAAKGRPVMMTYQQNRSGVGMPGDAMAVVTVGTLEQQNLTGTGPGIALHVKPDLLVSGQFKQGNFQASGTAVSAGYAGGAAASLLSAGIRASDLVKTLGLKPGQPLVIPMEVLTQLRR